MADRRPGREQPILSPIRRGEAPEPDEGVGHHRRVSMQPGPRAALGVVGAKLVLTSADAPARGSGTPRSRRRAVCGWHRIAGSRGRTCARPRCAPRAPAERLPRSGCQSAFAPTRRGGPEARRPLGATHLDPHITACLGSLRLRPGTRGAVVPECIPPVAHGIDLKGELFA